MLFHSLPGVENTQGRPRAGVGRAREDKPIAELAAATEGGFAEASDPDRDRSFWTGVDVGAIDRIELAFVAQEILRPERSHEFDLLVHSRATTGKVLTERVVFDVVPTRADSQPKSLAGEQIDIARLLRDQDGLSLWKDQHAAYELDSLRDPGQVAEGDEGIVKRIRFRIRAPELWFASFMDGAHDVVVEEDVVEADFFDGKTDSANGVRVAT